MSLLFYLRLTFWSYLFHTRKKSSHSAKRSLIFENQFVKTFPRHRGRKEWPLIQLMPLSQLQFNSIQFNSNRRRALPQNAPLTVTRPLKFHPLDEDLTSRKTHVSVSVNHVRFLKTTDEKSFTHRPRSTIQLTFFQGPIIRIENQEVRRQYHS